MPENENNQSPKKKRGFLWVIIIILMVVLAAVIGGTAWHIVAFPPVDSEVTARLEAIVQESVVRAEAGVETLEIGVLDDSVVVQPTEREGGRAVVVALLQAETITLHERGAVNLVVGVDIEEHDVGIILRSP